MKRILLAAATAALLLSACATSEKEASMAEQKTAAPATSGTRAYGVEMPSEPAIVALAQMDLAAAGDQPIKVSGRIGKVCQVKGCWMMLSDGDSAIRVKFGQDDFFIPKDSQGEAIAYGTLMANEMSLAESKHMAKDGGIDPDTVTKPQTEYQLIATGVILK
jgi:hypothetical protein